MATSMFQQAVDRRAWSVVALYLLLGVAEAASRLPPETLENLLQLLEGHGERDR